MTRVRLLPFAVFCLAVAVAALEAGEPPRPAIVAHRGLLQHAPENTLANFRACLELRLGFEFDVQRTKDGQLVCIHDDTVNRTTSGTGRVSELSLEQISRFDAGGWFDPRFTEVTAARLVQVKTEGQLIVAVKAPTSAPPVPAKT